MSLTEIKEKEAKGKKNVLPKLRTLVAYPYKQHSPVLPDNELQEFQIILKTIINESEYPKQTFATMKHIQLGLESSLRAINSIRFSCVFISLSLRPAHLVRVIATTAGVKCPTAPIYAQPKLEDFTYELFGVRALALVLPLDLHVISNKLAEWVESRKKSLIPKKVFAKRKRKSIVTCIQDTNVSHNCETQAAAPIVKKDWSGDYISCANDVDVLKLDQMDSQKETEKLSTALSKLINKCQTDAQIEDDNTFKEETVLPNTVHMEIDSSDPVEEDEFLLSELSTYQPLTVHQIRANPNKKPKKKRNKTKNTQHTPKQTKTN